MSSRSPKWKKAWDDKKSFRVINYDFWHDIWMPRRHEVYDVMAWLKSTYRPDADRILDLGAGTGAVALRFLRDDPKMKVTLLDGSRPQLATARKRYRESKRKARFVYRDLNSKDWYRSLGDNWPLIASNAAIHHLPDTGKRRVFRDVRRLLAPGGLFLYGDIIKFDDSGREDHAFTMWNDDIRDKFVERKLELRRSRDMMKQNLMEAAVKDGDLPFTIDSVLESLDRAGFAQSSLVWFYLKYAVFVAVAK